MRKIFLVLAVLLIGVMMVIPAITQEDTESTLVRVAHFSPDTPAVDVYVNGEVAISNLAYPEVTGWVELAAGTVNIAVAPTGTSIDDAAIGPADFTLPANSRITISAVGSLEAGTLMPNVFTEDFSGVGEGEAYVTVYHAIADASSVDVVNLDDGTVVIDSLGYPGTFDNNDGAFSLVLPAGTYNLGVVPDGDADTVLLDLSGTTFEGNNAYLVTAIGSLAEPTVSVEVTDLFLDSFARPSGTLGDVLVSNPNFSTLVTVATAEGVNPDIAATLFNPDADLTVFAPTNDAFESLLSGLGTDAATLLQYPDLIDTILLYHVVEGAVGSDVVTTLNGQSVPTLLEGESVEVQVSGTGVKLDYFADVIVVDVNADNGVIHVINEVLLPQTAISRWNEITRELELAALAESSTTIDEVAAGDENFSTLVSLVTAPGVDPAILATLSDPRESLTVFAPTNDAFAAMLADLNIDPAKLVEYPELINTILLYHVVDGAVTSDVVVTLGGESVPTLLDGESVEVQVTNDGTVKLDFTATVTAVDILADNGVIHVIDQVLLPQTAISQYNELRDELAPPPPPEEGTEEEAAAPVEEVTTIADIATGDENFSTLVSLVTAEGVDPAILELLANPEASITVFAPTNAAFEAMLTSLNIDPTKLVNYPDLINTILLYHVVDGAVTSDAVVGLDGESVPTLLEGESIEIQVTNDGTVKLDFTATVTAVDIQAANGVVHVIDQVLLPQTAISQYNTIRDELAPPPPPEEEGEGDGA